MEGLETISAPETGATESVETTEQVLNPEGGNESQVAEETSQVDGEQKESLETTEVKTEESADGRTVPAKFKELFKDPNFKELKDVWFTAQALKREGGLPRLREFRQKYEQLGGDEGVQAIEAERSEWAAIDEQFSNGDPRFVEGIASSDPEAFVKLIPSVLEQFQKLDSQQYNHILGRVVFNTLNNWPIGEIYNALKEAKPELAEALAQHYNGIKELAEKVPEKKVDPEREKISQERTELEKEKVRHYQGGVSKDISGFLEAERNSKFDQYLKPYGKDVAALKAKDPEIWDEMVKSLDAEVGKALKADAAWGKTYNSILDTRDHEKAVKHAKAKIESLLPDLMKKVTGRFFRFATPQKQAATNGKPNVNGQKPNAVVPAGTVKITAMPKSTDIDWARTRAAGLDVLDKNCYLKGRKEKVSWA